MSLVVSPAGSSPASSGFINSGGAGGVCDLEKGLVAAPGCECSVAWVVIGKSPGGYPVPDIPLKVASVDADSS